MKLPQFTLRDLFWLVALVAMSCGWWISRSDSLAQIERLQLQSEEHRSWLETIAKYKKLLAEQDERVTARLPQRASLPACFPVLVNAQHEAMIKEMANDKAKP